MFLTYLRRELRRRMRQAIFVALGLAVGIGLVIIVTAVSSGVKNAKPRAAHAVRGGHRHHRHQVADRQFRHGAFGSATAPAPGRGGHHDRPPDTPRGPASAPCDSAVTTVAKLKGVAAAAGRPHADGEQRKITTFKIPAIKSGAGAGGLGGGGGTEGRRGFRVQGSFRAGNSV